MPTPTVPTDHAVSLYVDELVIDTVSIVEVPGETKPIVALRFSDSSRAGGVIVEGNLTDVHRLIIEADNLLTRRRWPSRRLPLLSPLQNDDSTR